MLDPGALGTLIIGLDAVRHEQESSGDAVPLRPRKAPRPTIRLVLAKAFRGLADMLEPSPRWSPSGRP